MSETVVTTQLGAVAVIELNRPDAMNAVNTQMRGELYTALDKAARDPAIGAVVLTGSGKSFCSGADLKAAAKNPDQSTRRTARTLLHDFQPILECITRLDKPVIAAVNGGAIGVGMSFALACDFLVMAENAYLLAPFVNIGLIPDGGAAWFLTRRIGYGRALEILMEGQKLEARRCHELGLANRIVAADGLREGALAWAAQLAARAPLAMALTKRIARLSLTTGLSDALTVEAEFQTFLATTQDAKEAIAAFGEKRTPTFQSR
jgi:2-(1,2-epoxy-1,2-dihydrophenyl)acetyl-CoA isomerase